MCFMVLPASSPDLPGFITRFLPMPGCISCLLLLLLLSLFRCWDHLTRSSPSSSREKLRPLRGLSAKENVSDVKWTMPNSRPCWNWRLGCVYVCVCRSLCAHELVYVSESMWNLMRVYVHGERERERDHPHRRFLLKRLHISDEDDNGHWGCHLSLWLWAIIIWQR